MDLNQRKLTKSEWQGIEVPVSQEEKDILELIIRGFHDVNIKYNKHNSLFGFLKIDYSETMEDYLYNKYFASYVIKMKEKYPAVLELGITVHANPVIKKADLIRLEKNNAEKMKLANAVEYLLLDIVKKILHSKQLGNSNWVIEYFTLFKLTRITISNVNRHIKQIVKNILAKLEDEIDMSVVISNAVEFIEKNSMLLAYSDSVLYEHQKQVFTLMKNPGPKLVLYIAPTGTGKTMSPIGLSEKNRIIFVCAARHVGLALARAAISVNKKIAFAFGCASADDIRLHYFAAKEYTKHHKSGGIGKVDNSVGDKVEIMICDIKSYLPAMLYMKAFNPVEDIIVYWDEPTITMDYEDHELHEIIKRNWRENLIPNMILSSATLPKLHELSETTVDFQRKFEDAQIYNIVSHDCKKSIPIINKNGHVVLPHTMSNDYTQIDEIVKHCENNLTLLRYFDLKGVVEFIHFVESNDYVSANAKVGRHFASIDDVNMQNIKMHYLRVLKKIQPEMWPTIYHNLKLLQGKRIQPNTDVDTKGNKLRKTQSVGPGTIIGGLTQTKNDALAGQPLSRLMSEQVPPQKAENANANANVQEEQCAIYITTKDAYTLTDGPTIFLANDVAKVAKFCIQQANIPVKVMEDIMGKIEFNNKVNQQIVSLEKQLEDLVEKLTLKNDTADDKGGAKGKKSEAKVKTASGSDAVTMNKLEHGLEQLRSMIKSAQLNELFVPNKSAHIEKWTTSSLPLKNAFTSDIDEEFIIEIMSLNDIEDSWKILLLMGIGVFTNHPSITYTEIMKKMADQQKLYIIIASSDYIYGTNYQFCHGYLSKDLSLTQEKIIQALGRIGRNNIQQDYTIRFRDDEQIQKLFYVEHDKPEVRNMNILFNTRDVKWNGGEFAEIVNSL
jgi:hypothetical protein